MNRLKNIHAGEIPDEEFLIPMGKTTYRLSIASGIPQSRTSQIIKGRRRITADTACAFQNTLEQQRNSGPVCKIITTLKKKGKTPGSSWS